VPVEKDLRNCNHEIEKSDSSSCFSAAVMITTVGCASNRDALYEKGQPTRVLFIGNSLTYTNDLPDMFAKLAQSGGQRVEVEMQWCIILPAHPVRVV
jgi:hypothetical protein